MNVEKELIRKVAKNARLDLTEEELDKFLPEFNDILEYFKRVDDANTDGIEPSFQPIEVKNVMRDDVVEKSLTQDEALANTKHKKDGFFKGPKVV